MDSPVEDSRNSFQRVRRAETCMVGRDGWALRSILTKMQSLPGDGVLGMALIPYVAFYAVEAYDWLRRNTTLLPTEPFSEQDSAIRALRARIKILDGHKAGVGGIIAMLEECERRSVEWFNRHHVGILGLFKRWIQDDLGVFFLGPDLVCTSHIGFANMSLGDFEIDSNSPDPFHTLGQRAYQFSYEVAQFINSITKGLSALNGSERPGFPDQDVIRKSLRYEDHKAANFYRRLRERLGIRSGTVSQFTLMISQVNFVHRWLRTLFRKDDEFFFRARYLTVYHTLRGLRQLSAAVSGDKGTIAGRVASDLLATSEAQFVRKLKPRLRNAIAHYALAEDMLLNSDHNRPLDGVIRAVSSTYFNELDDVIDRQLDRMSHAFRQVVAVGSWARLVEER